MAERTDSEQSRHDEAVAHYAERFRGGDIEVRADHPDYEAPEEANGETPDVVASSERVTRVYEIETDEGDDEDQRAALREWAEGHPRRLFRWGVVGEDGTVDRWRE